jgi:hypothetical protein|tara:strand:- start:218 stop:598 length:381 start_codon:yes stop_codon:yes gene_type:complete
MKITGTASDGFKSYLIDWTITPEGVESHGGSLDISGLSVSGALPATPVAVEEVVYTDGYEEQSVVELRTLLSQRSEPVYGNKSDLINRLRAWDAANPDGLEEVVAVEDSGDSEEAAVDESEAETSE